MLFILSLCMFGLLMQGDAQDRASLWRGNDRSGRCQYTFTVPSPTEASCPQVTPPEVEGLKARLSVLEALVSQLSGKDTQLPGALQGTGIRSHSELQEALNQVMGERNLLQGEKERMERELEGFQRRMEEMRRETERLRNRPCPPHTPMVQTSSSQQDRNPIRPAAGEKHSSHFPQKKLNNMNTTDSCLQK